MKPTPPKIVDGDTSPGAAGRFIRYVSKLRNCWGRRESKTLLRTIVNDQGHPQREQAMSHYLSDLAKLDDELLAIIKGEEYLADASLSTRTRTKVARLLLHFYTTSVKSPTGASRAADFLFANNHRDAQNGIVDFILENFAESVGGSLVAGKRQTEIVAPAYALEIDVNAYPNPFRTSTTIEFTLEEPADIKLTVYDVLGREVQRLVHASLYEGYYRFRFTPEDYLAQSLYFYRLESGRKMKVGKLIFLK